LTFPSGNLNEPSVSIVEGVEKWVSSIHESILPNSQETFVDYTPRLKMEFESETAAYEFYNEYSRRIGFGIRREYDNKSKKDGILTSRRFSCFKEGKRGDDKRVPFIYDYHYLHFESFIVLTQIKKCKKIVKTSHFIILILLSIGPQNQLI